MTGRPKSINLRPAIEQRPTTNRPGGYRKNRRTNGRGGTRPGEIRRSEFDEGVRVCLVEYTTTRLRKMARKSLEKVLWYWQKKNPHNPHEESSFFYYLTETVFPGNIRRRFRSFITPNSILMSVSIVSAVGFVSKRLPGSMRKNSRIRLYERGTISFENSQLHSEVSLCTFFNFVYFHRFGRSRFNRLISSSFCSPALLHA